MRRAGDVTPVGRHPVGNFLSKSSAPPYRVFTASALALSLSRQTEGATMDFSQEQVSLRAYELWELEGRPHGRDQAHWFEAERQVQAVVSDEHAAPRSFKRTARKR